jgi:hypothetical protein
MFTVLYMRYSKRSQTQAQTDGEKGAENVSGVVDGALKMGDMGNGSNMP